MSAVNKGKALSIAFVIVLATCDPLIIKSARFHLLSISKGQQDYQYQYTN
jgi:hypothetical protein